MAARRTKGRGSSRSSRRSSRRSGNGEGSDEKALASAKAYIAGLMGRARGALRELEVRGEPGTDMGSLVGYMNRYRNEDWYERYYR
jgi:hypothetical protein